MKTSFRPRTNTPSPLKKRLALVLAVLLVAGSSFHFFRSSVISLARPAWVTENAVARGFGNLFQFFRDKDTLLQENRALREELASHEASLTSFRVLEGLYEELLVNFGREALAQGISAAVLAHPPETPYDIFVIDVGAREGVEVGDHVSLPQGGALGVITEVFEREAKVGLFSGSNIETSARLERGGVSVILLGEGGGVFKTLLPRDVSVEVGDKILLPGIRGELVGVVVEVELSPTDSEKKILIRGVENISKVRFVIVK